jgi:poly-beta-1,6-N-acetyl-D-glucosamine synthase
VNLLVNAKRSGKAAAMNKLVAAAKHPILLMSDANVLLSPDVPRKLVNRLNENNVGAVTGEVRLVGSHQEFSAGESLYYWMERRIQSAESRIGSVMGVDGGMYLLTKTLFQPLPEDTILDDFLVSINVLRANYRIVYDGSAQAVESGTPTTRQEFARRVRIAAGAVQLLRRWNVPRISQPVYWIQFVSHKLLRWISPILFVLLFTTNCLLLTRNAWYQASLLLQVVVIGWVVATWRLPATRNSRLGAVVFYFGFSQVAMLIGLLKGLVNLQEPQWEKAQRTE